MTRIRWFSTVKRPGLFWTECVSDGLEKGWNFKADELTLFYDWFNNDLCVIFYDLSKFVFVCFGWSIFRNFISLKLMIESVFLNAGKIYFLLNGLINASAKRKYKSVTRYYHIIWQIWFRYWRFFQLCGNWFYLVVSVFRWVFRPQMSNKERYINLYTGWKAL